MDYIKTLAGLALASRLKRLSERLMRDVSRIYRDQKIDFEPRWFPIFYLLSIKSMLSVTEAAEALGMTHPAIIQVSGAMEKRGYLDSVRDRNDERRRLMKLTPKGRALKKTLQPLWSIIKEESDRLFEESSQDFLDILTKIEGSLDKVEMYDRIKNRLIDDFLRQITIVDYAPAYKKDFKALNIQWLKEYFEPEEEDLKILSDPGKYIVDNGGKIFFALYDKKVIGTAALIKVDDTVYELAKMAVAPEMRGRHVGKLLTRKIINEAIDLKAREIVLLTSKKLVPAVELYKEFGFEQIKSHKNFGFKHRRKSIMMRLLLHK